MNNSRIDYWDGKAFEWSNWNFLHHIGFVTYLSSATSPTAEQKAPLFSTHKRTQSQQKHLREWTDNWDCAVDANYEDVHSSKSAAQNSFAETTSFHDTIKYKNLDAVIDEFFKRQDANNLTREVPEFGSIASGMYAPHIHSSIPFYYKNFKPKI